MNPVVLVLTIILILLLVGAMPGVAVIPHAWGYWPSTVLFIVLLVLLILVLTGRFR